MVLYGNVTTICTSCTEGNPFYFFFYLFSCTFRHTPYITFQNNPVFYTIKFTLSVKGTDRHHSRFHRADPSRNNGLQCNYQVTGNNNRIIGFMRRRSVSAFSLYLNRKLGPCLLGCPAVIKNAAELQLIHYVTTENIVDSLQNTVDNHRPRSARRISSAG